MNPIAVLTGTARHEACEVRDAKTNARLLFGGAAIVGAIAALLFLAFPGLDLATSDLFYRGNGIFAGKAGGVFSVPPATVAAFIRLVFYVSFIAVCVTNAIGIAVTLIGKRRFLGLNAPRWLFLAACLIIGPGIVANVILKDHWGRARPAQTVAFGGSKTFTPPLIPSDQCDRNCSFVAGEPSMMYATVFAAAFLFPAIGRGLLATGVAMGLVSGMVRISQGGHFLSDVIFAGVTMALTVTILYVLLGPVLKMYHRDADATAQHPPVQRSV